MQWYHYVFGAVLILISVIITIVVLMQEGHKTFPVLLPAVRIHLSENQKAEQSRASLKDLQSG